MPQTAIFLSARMKATRLPNKQMLPIAGRPVTAHLIDRIKVAKRPAVIVLTTSTDPQDTPLVELARQEGIQSFRGSPEDKLDRYLQAARRFDVEFATVVDGDDLFCDPEVIDRVIELYEKKKADFITGRDLPLGATCFGIRIDALQKVCESKTNRDTEIWGNYFTKDSRFQVAHVDMDPSLKRPELRMTLDYPEDLQFFEAVFQRLYKPGHVFTLRDVIALLNQHPEIAELNQGVQTLYEQNLEKVRAKAESAKTR
jgi:spore coat polysaccharide biosynthesis protein SpsF